VSHELRQPLSAVRLNAETGALLLGQEPPDVHEARAVFRDIVKDNARAVEVIEHIRLLLRRDTEASAPVSLNDICRNSAKLLKGAGFAANEVGNALKSAYGATADQVAKWLRGAGFAANEVAGALKSAFNVSVDQAAKLLQQAGYAVNDVGNALKSAYNASADVAAKALRGAGYAVDQVGNVMKSAYGVASDQVNNVLKGAGYAASEVDKFFGKAGEEIKCREARPDQVVSTRGRR